MTRFRVVTAAALAAGLALSAGVLAQQPTNPLPDKKPLPVLGKIAIGGPQQPSNLLPVQGQPKTLIQPKLAVGQPAQPQVVGAAAELPVVPKSSAAFLSLKVSDVIDHPDLKTALEPL